MEYLFFGFGLLALVFGTLATFAAFIFRRVVSTNEVHIVQAGGNTISYGKDTGNGNAYYEWPSWIPYFGITRITLPVSVFDLDLDAYEAYDKGRLPFVVDVKAFFRISNSDVAAKSVASFNELQEQLRSIVQGAVRVILASNDIEEILQGRSTFGEQFTKEVAEQLTNWGVSTVKNIELMDIRDSSNNHVIRNIMEKKKSHIEMESRTEVAKNMRSAQIAEIEAKKEVDLQTQSAKQTVGLRTIETQQSVELQEQAKVQAVKEQERTTKEKEMNILQVQEVRKAEILKQMTVIKAEQDKTTAILVAEGQLESKRREAEGITLEGTAKADAERAMLLAPVEAQTTLAKEIGENKSYQQYLVTIRQVEANQIVGVAQAEALSNAEVKVIANTGNAASGLSSVMDIFSSKGGTELGAMLEGFANTDKGKEILDKVTGTTRVTLPTKPVLNGKGNGIHQ